MTTGNAQSGDPRDTDRTRGGDNMGAFDKLPKALRQALASADHNWSAGQLFTEYRKPRAKRRPMLRDAATAAAFIKQQDAEKHARDAERGMVCPGQR